MPGDPTPGSLAQKDATTLGNMICRDFLRGVCYRAENCKFLHSEQHAPTHSSQLPVCRDYQNGTCNRRNCKYAHIYSSSGFYDPATMTAVPQGGTSNNRGSHQSNTPNKDYSRQGGMMDQQHYEEVFKTRASPNDPLCKDFQNGYCQRGENCRYKHVSYIQEPTPYHQADAMPPNDPRNYPYNGAPNGQPSMYPSPGRNYPPQNPADAPYSMPAKRPYMGGDSTGMMPPSVKQDSSDLIKEIEFLRNENVMLHEDLASRYAEIEALKNELSHYRQFPPPAGVHSGEQTLDQNKMFPPQHNKASPQKSTPPKPGYNNNNQQHPYPVPTLAPPSQKQYTN